MRSAKVLVTLALLAAIVAAAAVAAVIAARRHRADPVPVAAGPVPDLSIPPTSGNNALPRPRQVTDQPLGEGVTTQLLPPRVPVDPDPPRLLPTRARISALAADHPAGDKPPPRGNADDLPLIDADKLDRPGSAAAPGIGPPVNVSPAPRVGSDIDPRSAGSPLNVAGENANGRKPGLAVIPFTLLGPVPEAEKDAGAILAEQVLGETSQRSYTLYERTQITALLKEQKFEESDLASKPAVAAKFGRLSGITYLVVGTLSRLDGGYHLSARVVDCQSGQVGERARISAPGIRGVGERVGELTTMLGLSGANGQAARPAQPAPTPAPDAPRTDLPPRQPAPVRDDPPPPRRAERQPLTVADLIEARNPEPAFRVVFRSAEGDKDFVEGERIHFVIRSDRDCYLTVLAIDAAGAITTLLPNRYVREPRAARAQEYHLPADDAAYDLTAEPPLGKTQVKLIASVRPMKLEGLTAQRQGEATFVQVSAASRAIGIRPHDGDAAAPLATSLDDLFGADGWADASLVVNTVAKGGQPTPTPPNPPAPQPSPIATGDDPNEAVIARFREVCQSLGVQSLEVNLGLPGHFEMGEINDLIVLRAPADDDAPGTRALGVDGKTSRTFRQLLGDAKTTPASSTGARAVGGGGADVAERIAKLSKEPGVVAVLPNVTVYASAAESRLLPVQWALRNEFSAGNDVGWRRVAERCAAIAPPLIGVVDQGLNVNDPRVLPIAWTNPNEVPGNGVDDDGNGFIDDVHGFNFVLNNADLFDSCTRMNHGTFCATIIGGRGTGGPGDVQGLAPRALVIPAVALMPPADNPAGKARGGYKEIRAAIAYVVANGARVINLSLGSHVDRATLDQINRDPLWDELERMGVIVVCAAGNENTDNDANPCFPASLPRPNIVSVMATDAAGRLGRGKGKAGWQVFTNYGRRSVHLAAPGSVILSIPNNGAVELSNGTSFSAPMVTAAMALVWGQHPDWDAKTVIRAVLETTTPLDALRDKCTTGGVLNLPGALDWKPAAAQ